MGSARLLAVVSIFALACGDASAPGSDHWGGIHGGNGDNSGGDNGGWGADAGSDGAPAGEAGGSTETQAFQLTADKTSYDVELRASVTVQITVAPQSFTGAVALSVSGLATGVTGSFSPASVNVSGTTSATSTLTLTTLESVLPATTPFTVTATSGADTATTAPSLHVMSQITVHIPMNVEAMAGTSGNPSTDAFGNYPIVINAPANFGANAPVVVRFVNDDSDTHCIHATNPNQGFPHDSVTNGVCNTPMAHGDVDKTAHAINTKGSYLFYLHDEGDTTDGMIKVQ